MCDAPVARDSPRRSNRFVCAERARRNDQWRRAALVRVALRRRARAVEHAGILRCVKRRVAEQQRAVVRHWIGRRRRRGRRDAVAAKRRHVANKRIQLVERCVERDAKFAAKVTILLKWGSEQEQENMNFHALHSYRISYLTAMTPEGNAALHNVANWRNIVDDVEHEHVVDLDCNAQSRIARLHKHDIDAMRVERARLTLRRRTRVVRCRRQAGAGRTIGKHGVDRGRERYERAIGTSTQQRRATRRRLNVQQIVAARRGVDEQRETNGASIAETNLDR